MMTTIKCNELSVCLSILYVCLCCMCFMLYMCCIPACVCLHVVPVVHLPIHVVCLSVHVVCLSVHVVCLSVHVVCLSVPMMSVCPCGIFACNFIRSKWEPSPALPFLPPKHLRDKIDDFEINEAPSIGLPPRPLGGGSGSAPPSEELPGQPSAKLFTDEDMEFFVS